MIIPAGHRLLVKPFKIEEVDEVMKKHSAFLREFQIVKGEGQEKREAASVDRATVVAVGATAFKDFGGEPWCKVGDQVFIAKHAGKVVNDPADDEMYLLLNDEDIVAIIKDSE